MDTAPQSAAWQLCLAEAERFAPLPYHTLVLGPPGSGKTTIVRMMAERAGLRLVEVNCAAIPESLFESELFGHERGAFTGAAARREGYFEQAKGGALYLDEIGELPQHLQAKLLRALETRRIQRIGGTAEVSIDDVRVFSATNRTPETLRRDVFDRAGQLVLRVPGLAERRGEIPEIVASVLEDFPGASISPGFVRDLAQRTWPGNIRQLVNCVRQAASLRSPDGEVLAEDVLRRLDVETGARGQALDPCPRKWWVDYRPDDSVDLARAVVERLARAGEPVTFRRASAAIAEAYRGAGAPPPSRQTVWRRMRESFESTPDPGVWAPKTDQDEED